MVEFRRRTRTPHSQDADVVLRARRGVCVGYANLFAEMCAFVNVECRVIGGDCITSDGGGPHAWNVLRLGGGAWYLCDPTWAAGHRSGAGDFVSCLDLQWWCTKPEVFIRTHLPDAVKWQLLEKPISKADFDKFRK
jgi:transglutaminase/protease-like cytokinesis protein 3